MLIEQESLSELWDAYVEKCFGQAMPTVAVLNIKDPMLSK